MAIMKAMTAIGISALLAATGCTAGAPDDQHPEASVTAEAKVNEAKKADPELSIKMKAQCFVNDEGTEAICCGRADCWYVDLGDDYSYR